MTDHCDRRVSPNARARAEHETVEDCAGRTGERPAEAAGGVRQRRLQDLGQSTGPSRDVPSLQAIRHAWAAMRACA